jgi:hypothetical protein
MKRKIEEDICDTFNKKICIRNNSVNNNSIVMKLKNEIFDLKNEIKILKEELENIKRNTIDAHKNFSYIN